MLPQHIRGIVEAELGAQIQSVAPVGGGCIDHACRVETPRTVCFLKWGTGDVGQSFEAEAYGLSILRAAKSPLVIPEILAVHPPKGGHPGLILMEWVEHGQPGKGFWEKFGRGLALLHRTSTERYGADRDTFIGRLPQRNTWTSQWPDFFRSCRLEPQVQMAREAGRWLRAWDHMLDQLYKRLDAILPEQPDASVVHGDLWGGNFMVTSGSTAALIDPAAYHGHRDTDRAMTELFGGFDARFYAAYEEVWPLEPEYAQRRDVYNLYHLINHLNHFGAEYARSIESTLIHYA